MPKNIAIKVARAQKDMTQKALAEAAGISRQTMNAIEKGEYNPTIKLCRRICRILDKSLDDLFWDIAGCRIRMLDGFLGIAGCNTDPDSHRK